MNWNVPKKLMEKFRRQPNNFHGFLLLTANEVNAGLTALILKPSASCFLLKS